MEKTIQVSVRLPNGRSKQFQLTPGSNWRKDLTDEIRALYPRSRQVELVADIRTAGSVFESNVMFRRRENFFELGHVEVRMTDKRADRSS